MLCLAIRQRFLVCMMSLLGPGCSQGSLQVPGTYDRQEQADMKRSDTMSMSLRLLMDAGADEEWYFGKNGEFYELMAVIRSGTGENIVRYIFKNRVQGQDLDIRTAALMPLEEFNPLGSALCVLKLDAALESTTVCPEDGASTCKLYEYRNYTSYADTHNSSPIYDCDRPSPARFVVKFSPTGETVLTPSVLPESWSTLERINVTGVKSRIIQLSSEDQKFSWMTGYMDAEQLVVAGREGEAGDIVAKWYPLTSDGPAAVPSTKADDSTRVATLPDSAGKTYFGRMGVDKDLFVFIPSGVYRIRADLTWETLPLPEGFVMPELSAVKRIEGASGGSIGAFRIITKGQNGSELNQILVWNATDAKLSTVPFPAGEAPDFLANVGMFIVNGEIWLWVAGEPRLARRFSVSDNTWQMPLLELPVEDEVSLSGDYQMSPAGRGFVLSSSYQKLNDSGLPTQNVRRIYRHYYFNATGVYTDTYIDTYASPEALHFHDSKMLVERVLGIDNEEQLKVMEYGYVYDFAMKRGHIFRDTVDGVNGPTWLSRHGSLHLNGNKALVFGGCDKPENGTCFGQMAFSRLLEFPTAF